MKSKKYLTYAIGEILLIVVGVLLAMYINNRNTQYQYKRKIDKNIVRVYEELENNIQSARENIEWLQFKDSMIYLYMNDSLTKEDYQGNLGAPYLIVQSNPLKLEDNAYENLTNLNISTSRYQDSLINNLKQVYAQNYNISRMNDKLASFVADKSIPFLSEEIKSFSDITYKQEVNDEAIDFYLTSDTYKSYVSQYAIIAINNQLESAEQFYKDAIAVYHQISQEYNLVNKFKNRFTQSVLSKHEGLYLHQASGDTMSVYWRNDSLIFHYGGTYKLTPITENRFFVYSSVRPKFFSFYQKDSSSQMRIHVLSDRWVLEKIENGGR